MLDYARVSGDEGSGKLAADSAKKFFLADKNCPLAYEPSGEDFLSPCLGEADVMRRVLPPDEFAKWLTAFMPQIPGKARRLAAGGGLAGPERSEAGASRWVKPEPGLDAGGDCFGFAG